MITYNRDQNGELFPVGAGPSGLEPQIIALVYGSYRAALEFALRENQALVNPVTIADMENHDACFATLAIDGGDTTLTIYQVRDVYLLEVVFTGITEEEPDYPAEPYCIIHREVVISDNPVTDIKSKQKYKKMTEEEAWREVFYPLI